MTNLILACVLSGITSLILGFIWYHPKVFGTAWMNETGLTPEDAQKGNMPLIFGLTFLISAYMAYEMKWINHDDPLTACIHGMYHGARHVGLFAIGALTINALFEQKSAKYILINAGYWLVVFAFIGAILAVFPSFSPKEKAADAEDTGMHMEWNDAELINTTNQKQEETYYLVS